MQDSSADCRSDEKPDHAKLVPIIQQSVGLTVEMTSKRLTETTVSFMNRLSKL